MQAFVANYGVTNMNNFYFFERGGICETMTAFLQNKTYEKYLREPIDYKGKKTKFYLVLNWIHRNNHGANIEFIKQLDMNYIESLNDLPEGGGVYAVGYDVDLEDLNRIKKENIPFIEDSCPRIRLLRDQLLSVNPKTHQVVFMIYDYHLVYSCYESAFPEDIIIINPENYLSQFALKRNNKPIHLLVYGVFRPKEVQQVISHIKDAYNNADNILDSYNATRCCWTKQGLLEEIDAAIAKEKLNEVWVVCSNEEDTSTRGIAKEILENGASVHYIKSNVDIPESVDAGKKYGVIVAPIPLSEKIMNCVDEIKSRYCER